MGAGAGHPGRLGTAGLSAAGRGPPRPGFPGAGGGRVTRRRGAHVALGGRRVPGSPALAAKLPRLVPGAWLVLGSELVSALGSGMTAPLLVVYLHGVRGIPLGPATLAAAVGPLVSFFGNPLGGLLADRLGARRVIVIGLAVAAVATAALGMVHSLASVVAAIAFMGGGLSIALPSQDSLLGHLVPPEQRPTAFALRYLSFNLGMGAGGLIAALAVDTKHPSSFTLAYAADGATFLLAALAITGPALRGATPARRTRIPLREALPHSRPLWVLCGLGMLFTLVGFGQFKITTYGITGASTRLLGFAYLANTLTVVAAQMPVLRLTRTWLRHRTLAVVGVMWGAAWLLIWSADRLWGGCLVVAAAVIALGECLMSTSLPPTINDLAPSEELGRYNASFLMARTLGNLAAPALAAAFLSTGLGPQLALFLAALACAIALPCLRLPRLMSAPAETVR
ncbi:MFS transporter [Streptomyces sp. NPDC020490]|uniref:MFS transporter n=1 Tax=Streptomyces sp. NPDC020490 TaxID=3365078 RepID=UPI0037B6647B